MTRITDTTTIIRTALAVCLALAALYALAPAAAAAPPPSSAKALDGVVNLNTATEAQLIMLPRVGEKVARRIIDFRDQHGPFQRPEDLMNVQGIGEKVFDRLKPHLAVEGETTLRRAVVPAEGGAAKN